MDKAAYVEMAGTERTHWWFIARRKIIFTVIKKLSLPSRARVLEIGSGTGGNLRMLAKFGAVSAMEMNDFAREYSQAQGLPGCDMRGGSCPYDIPFQGDTFDLVCMFDVLEHINEEFETLRAIRSLVAVDGRLLVTVPAYQWLWGGHDRHLHHKRRYNAARLRAVLNEAGYEVEQLSYFNTLLFPAALVIRLKERLLATERPAGTRIPSPWLNAALRNIFALEALPLGMGWRLPFGVSLMAVARVASRR